MVQGSIDGHNFFLLVSSLIVISTLVRAARPAFGRVDRLSYLVAMGLTMLFFGERVLLSARNGDITMLRFAQYFMAGGICAFFTHAACTPIDVVKTRIQTMPGKYMGMVDGFTRIVSDEGYGTLLKGLGATAGGYFLHGAFKYSFYEIFKTILSHSPGDALKPGFAIASVAGFFAECIACILLCPMEAIRIRSVSDPSFPSAVLPGMRVIMRLEGLYGFYKGLPAIVLKQVPYTVGQFVSFELSLTFVKYLVNTLLHLQLVSFVSWTAGLLAGISAGIMSHPGDTILSKINNNNNHNQDQSDGSAITLIIKVARHEGIIGLFVGLLPRLVQVSLMIGGQFAIYDTIKQWCGLKVAAAIPDAIATAVDVGSKLTPVKMA